MTNKRNYNPRYQNNYDRYGVGNYKRTTCRVKGKKYFEKTFADKKYCENYLNKVKQNARYPFYYKVENNKDNTQTLKLFRAEYWEE